MSHRSTVASASRWTLATASLAIAALAGPGPALAAEECASPQAGFHACLQVHYQTAGDGAPEKLRTTATLVQRVPRCSGVRSRRVTVRIDGGQVAAARPAASCRAGIARWRTVFSPRETGGWDVASGSRIVTSWDGTTATAAVTVSGAPAKPQPGRTIKSGRPASHGASSSGATGRPR